MRARQMTATPAGDGQPALTNLTRAARVHPAAQTPRPQAQSPAAARAQPAAARPSKAI